MNRPNKVVSFLGGGQTVKLRISGDLHYSTNTQLLYGVVY